MKPFQRYTSAIALILASISLPHAHAATTTSTSKEDQNLEAQGDATGMIFKHGMGEVEYRTQFNSSGALGSVGLKIETAILGPWDIDGDNGILMNAFPIEVRVVLDPANATIFAPELVRADALKFLFPHLGLTIQALGYSFDQLQAGKARLNGFHVGEVTLSEAVSIDGNGGADFAITFKGNASFSIGTDEIPSGLSGDIRSDWKSENYNSKGHYYRDSAATEVSGSIGLRIKEAVLVELFGGMSRFSTSNTALIDLEYGAKARVMIFNKKLQITTTVAKQDSSYQGGNGTQNFDDGIRLVIGLEGHW